MPDWSALADELTTALRLRTPPIAITFSQDAPPGVPAYDAPLPPPTADGRTGRVPAGCVFWTQAVGRTFTTAPEDHGNCSVGSLTHGLIPLEAASTRADVAALVEAGWVTPDAFPLIPTVAERPRAITYGPLARTPVDPDVVLVRVNGRQMMVLHDALPDMYLGGKPQCHIVAIAKQDARPAASVGCALSRVRTAMPADEMTCALPASGLGEILERLGATSAADDRVATYAAEDSRRFSE